MNTDLGGGYRLKAFPCWHHLLFPVYPTKLLLYLARVLLEVKVFETGIARVILEQAAKTTNNGAAAVLGNTKTVSCGRKEQGRVPLRQITTLSWFDCWSFVISLFFIFVKLKCGCGATVTLNLEAGTFLKFPPSVKLSEPKILFDNENAADTISINKSTNSKHLT